MSSRKWKSTFGSLRESKFDSDGVFLINMQLNTNAVRIKRLTRPYDFRWLKKVLIGQTLRNSRISLTGTTSEVFKSRVDVAQALGRIRSYSDEKRRLLSIVAIDYSYLTLQQLQQLFVKNCYSCKRSLYFVLAWGCCHR